MTAALYNLTWILACHEDEKYRNGQEAVSLAKKLCRIAQYKQPLALDVLAAAYAEAGRFDEAVFTGKKALKLALDQGLEDLSLGLRKKLRLYEAERPYRQTRSGKGNS